MKGSKSQALAAEAIQQLKEKIFARRHELRVRSDPLSLGAGPFFKVIWSPPPVCERQRREIDEERERDVKT